MPDNLPVILLNEKEMEVENLFQLVKTNHGEYINEDELEKVRKDIEVTVELAEKQFSNLLRRGKSIGSRL
jgi:hypothetical protein